MTSICCKTFKNQMQCINPGKVHVTTMHLKRKPIIVKFTCSKLPLRSPGLIDVHICNGLGGLINKGAYIQGSLKPEKKKHFINKLHVYMYNSYSADQKTFHIYWFLLISFKTS